MIPQVKMTGFFLVIAWLSFCMALLSGVHVGFTAETAENATIEFDGETYVAGNETTRNIYELNTTDEEKDEVTKAMTRFSSRLEENRDGFVPDRIDKPIENRTEAFETHFANQTLAVMFSINAAVGGPVAEWVYENRDEPWVHQDTLVILIHTLTFAPFLLMLYGMYRRVR